MIVTYIVIDNLVGIVFSSTGCFTVSRTAPSFVISQLTTRIYEQDTNKKVNLPREIRNIRELELVSSIFVYFKL